MSKEREITVPNTNDEILEEIPNNEDDISSSEDGNVSEDDYHLNVPSSDEDTSPSESSDNDEVVFEHTLKHKSFFATARQRRRRHSEYRKKGIVPSLHFSGSRRTDFWKNYGVHPNERLQLGDFKGIDSIFTADEFKKLGPSERRIHVNGQKFKIVNNSEISNNLYRAIAQALMMREDEFKIVRDAIHDSLVNHWSLFCVDVCNVCGKKLTQAEAKLLNPESMVDMYKKVTMTFSSLPEFELIAAALYYGFSYSIIDIAPERSMIYVRSCPNEYVSQLGTVKYYFLVSRNSWPYFEFLVPIGPLKKILDGQYPAVLRQAILVQKHRATQFQNQTSKEKIVPELGSIPEGFALDHRIFFHQSTISHDLWSLLAELMFRQLIYAPQIKHLVIDNKHDFALFYLACKAKKRFQVHGNASIQRLADDFSEFFSKESPRGDLDDLAQAALYFEFSYTVIGLDFNGNFYWKDYVAQPVPDMKRVPYFAFFVKTTADRMMFWYALEDIGRNCSKEKKLYGDVQSGDLRLWGGRFYFHDIPKSRVSRIKMASISSGFSQNLNIPFLSKLMEWIVNNFNQLRSTFNTTVNNATLKSRSVASRMFYTVRWLRRRKVDPDKESQDVYMKEQP